MELVKNINKKVSNSKNLFWIRIMPSLLTFILILCGIQNIDGFEVVAEARETGLISGTCGDNLVWTLNKEGKLVISGTGKISEFDYPENIKSVIIEHGVTSIGSHAFSKCPTLTDVTISSTVKSIGGYAFAHCSALTNINIPDSVISIGDSAFLDCSSLTDIIIPKGVTDIGYGMFSECTNLTSVDLPNGVLSIDYEAFNNCTSLVNLTIPDSVVYVGRDAFKNTPITNNQSTDVKYVNKWVVSCDLNALSVNVKNGTIGIAANAFSNCSMLNDITLPNGITEIGDSAFYNCSNLKSIIIPNGVNKIAINTFAHCSSLNSVVIPNSIDIIEGNAFGETAILNEQISNARYVDKWLIECDTNIKAIDINEGTIGIAKDAFYHCSTLSSITIPDSLKHIGDNVFYYTSAIKKQTTDIKYIDHWVVDCDINATSITIDDGTIGISDGAIDNCPWLSSVIIPNSVSIIGDGAFWCDDLNDVFYSGTKEEWNKIEIGPNNESLLNASINYTNDEDIPSINASKSKCGDNLTWVLDSDGVLTISGTGEMYDYSWGLYAYDDNRSPWHNNNNIKSIIINAGVTSIGSDAFYECSSLKTIVIPETVTSIGRSAFRDCTSLTDVIIPYGVPIIDSDCFHGCSSLSKITIPNSVKQIGSWSFQWCNSLTDIYYSGTEEEWDALTMGFKNDRYNKPLITASVHYNNAHNEVLVIEPILEHISITFEDQNMDIVWDDALFNHSPYEYDNNLAIATCTLSGLAENKESDRPTRDLLLKMGFSESSMQSDKFNEWNPYMPAYVFANKVITVNGKTKKLISVTVRGSQTIFADWLCTDFVDGALNGFTYSTEFVYQALSNYIKAQGLTSVSKEDTIFLITGHSLGGAVAAKLTTECISRGLSLQNNTYTYTFAAPRYSNETKQNKYGNVFELISKYDVVPNLGYPGNLIGTSHYGEWKEFDTNLVSGFYNYWNMWNSGILLVNDKINNHNITAYMAFLLTKADFVEIEKTAQKSYLISVRCPVDVELYDTDDTLIAKITNNIIDDSVTNTGVFCKVEGDEKYIFVESDKEIYVRLIGTDSGTMEYGVQKLKSLDEVTTEDNFITYKIVSLENGKEFCSYVTEKNGLANVSLYVIDPETQKPLKSVDLDGNENNLAEESHIWLYIVGAALIVVVTVIIVLIFYKKHKKRSFNITS